MGMRGPSWAAAAETSSISSYTGRNHGAVRQLPDPHGDIHVVLDNLEIAVREQHPDIDLRERGEKRRDGRQYMQEPEEHRRGQQQLSSWRVELPGGDPLGLAISSRMRRAEARWRAPASVSATRRVVRISSLVPRCFSSSFTLRLTVASGTRRFRLAAEKLAQPQHDLEPLDGSPRRVEALEAADARNEPK